MKNQNTALSGRNTMLAWLLAVNIVNSHAATDTADIGSDALPMGDAPASISSPTRLQQSLLDVPGSTTVVTNDMIRHYGITSIVDALRHVPGMAVLQADSGDVRASYHGTNILVPPRLNV